MVKLAVDQHDRPDPCIPRLAGRMKLRAHFELGEDIRRRIDENPVARIRAHRDRRLRASFRLERPLAKAAAVTAVAIPLWEAAARGSAEDEDSHLAPTGMNGIIAQRLRRKHPRTQRRMPKPAIAAFGILDQWC